MIKADILQPFVRKLERLTPLSPEGRQAVLSLPLVEKAFGPGSYLLRGDIPAPNCIVIGSGYAFRHRIVSNGSRQIISIEMAGDGVGLAASVGQEVNYSLQALTSGSAAIIPINAVRTLIKAFPEVLAGLWLLAVAEAAIQCEWIANVGRRNARARVAHFLCEFAERQASVTAADRDSFEFPLTQEQVGDVTGLTAVHVNRTLRAIDDEKVIQRDGRLVKILDWRRLTTIADFNPEYLRASSGSVA